MLSRWVGLSLTPEFQDKFLELRQGNDPKARQLVRIAILARYWFN